MEFLTIFLSSLISLISPVGLVLDRVAVNLIRSQFYQVGELQVRVDNAPSYQLLSGKLERVRIAGRSLQLQQNIRIAVLELETDPISLDLGSLRQRQPKLKQPINAGVRLVLTQTDINQALHSQEVATMLHNLGINLLDNSSSKAEPTYSLIQPRVELLANNRLRFQVELQEEQNVKPLAIRLESGLSVTQGRYIQLLEPLVYVDGERVPNQFISAIASSISQQLDLNKLKQYGLQARILQLKVTPHQQIEIAAFLRVEPSSRLFKQR